MSEPDRDALVAGVLGGETHAIADALACVEDVRAASLPQQRELLRALEAATPPEHGVVGLTGPPGAGKSTLASALIRHWLAERCGVGVVAVDPSSRRSGGALLGDRARLRFDAHERVFVRSMAARDRLGGLAPATRAAAVVLRAAFEWTVVETVGVGQSEVDVTTLADTVVLVLQPASGDTLQFMKAGILEFPDVFVVHKWDLGASAERTRADLEAMLALQAGPEGDWKAPVIGASAHTGVGIDELTRALREHRSYLAETGLRARRREQGRLAWALELFTERYGRLGLERLDGEGEAARISAATPGTALDCFSALAECAGLE